MASTPSPRIYSFIHQVVTSTLNMGTEEGERNGAALALEVAISPVGEHGLNPVHERPQ